MDQQPNTFTPAPKQSNGFAVGSLVCGIVSLVMTFFTAAYYPLFVGVVLGIIAIVLAVLAKKKGPSGMATAGLVLGIIGEYLGKIMLCINNTPQFIVRETINVPSNSNQTNQNERTEAENHA